MGFLLVCSNDVLGPGSGVAIAVNSITWRGFGVLQDMLDKSPRFGGGKAFLEVLRRHLEAFRVMRNTLICIFVLLRSLSMVWMGNQGPQVYRTKDI